MHGVAELSRASASNTSCSVAQRRSSALLESVHAVLILLNCNPVYVHLVPRISRMSPPSGVCTPQQSLHKKAGDVFAGESGQRLNHQQFIRRVNTHQLTDLLYVHPKVGVLYIHPKLGQSSKPVATLLVYLPDVAEWGSCVSCGVAAAAAAYRRSDVC